MSKIMEAPPGRERGWRRVHCTEAQADILRKVGWTEIGENKIMPEVRWGFVSDGSPPDQTIGPDTVVEPATVKPKRKYTRRVIIAVDDDGNAAIKPKRQYRRRDMTAEE